MGDNEINLEETLDKANFAEYPPHNFPHGVPKIRAEHRHVYYMWRDGDSIDWVLFNDPNDISELELYQLKMKKMIKIIAKNREHDSTETYIIFRKISPYAKGEAAYNILQSEYPVKNK